MSDFGPGWKEKKKAKFRLILPKTEILSKKRTFFQKNGFLLLKFLQHNR